MKGRVGEGAGATMKEMRGEAAGATMKEMAGEATVGEIERTDLMMQTSL